MIKLMHKRGVQFVVRILIMNELFEFVSHLQNNVV